MFFSHPAPHHPPPPHSRALPPRPSLHVGDLAACAAELARLQGLGDALLAAAPTSPSSAATAWAPIAFRYRWLRETLVAARAGASPLARTVYGAAADAALRARDWGEFLKSASHLVDMEEAGVEEGEAAAAAVAAVAPPPPPPPNPRPSAWGSDEEGEAAEGEAGPPPLPPPPPPPPPLPWRPGEALAALVLYFAAAAPTPQCLDAARLLRKESARRA